MSVPCADRQISRTRATTWWCYTCWCNMQHGKDPGGLSGQVGGWVGGRDPPELMRHIGITVWQGNPTQWARHQNRLQIGWTCVNSLQKMLHHCVQRSGLTNEPASSRGGGGSSPLPLPPARWAHGQDPTQTNTADATRRHKAKTSPCVMQ